MKEVVSADPSVVLGGAELPRPPAWRRLMPSFAVVAVLIAASFAASVAIGHSTRDAQRRLLDARADDAVRVLAGVALQTEESLAAGAMASRRLGTFGDWLRQRPRGRTDEVTALVDVRPLRPRVVESAPGARLGALEGLNAVQRAALRAAVNRVSLVALVGRPEARTLVVAGPAQRDGHVVYIELAISSLVTRVFAGEIHLDGAVYLAGIESPEALIGANTAELPITGTRVERDVALGVVPARIIVARNRVIIGGFMERAAAIALVLGCIVAIGVGILVEALGRRRDRAVALVARLRQSNEELDRLSDALGRQTLQDPLTGLGNRTKLLRYLGSLVERGEEGVIVVAIVDLDDFKAVNDTLGHPAGDALLAEVARRLEEPLTAPHVAFRLAGDEFALVARPRDADGEVDAFLTGILERISKPIAVGHREVFVEASVGVTIAGEECAVEDLLRDADIAMYRAKERDGGLRWERFAPEMLERIRERTELAADLRAGIESGEMLIEYQPIVDFNGTGKVLIEALARWAHPERGWLSPASFISVAEETGAIVELGEWVLRRACQDCAELRRSTPGVRVSVNVSGRQLKEESFAGVVTEALAESDLPAEALLVEITESVLVQEQEVRGSLDALRRMGVGLAIDDFGSGYASIDYLRRLPVDMVKVDRNVVQEDAVDGKGRLLAAIVQLGRSLDLQTLAEGIETPQQAVIVHACGFDFGQGFHFGRPAPLDAVALALPRLVRDAAIVI